MADRKITDLTALAAGSQATGDLLTIVDVSEAAATDKNKKITIESLFKGIPSNVGIGTSSPTNDLHVSSTSNVAARFESSTSAARIRFKDPNGDAFLGNVGDALAFYTSSSLTERMRIKSDGTLHTIKSGTQITNAEQTVAVFQRSSASGSTSKISIVSGNGAASHINFGDTDDEDVGQLVYNHSNNSMQFLTNTSERLRIDSSGRLYVGTTTAGFANGDDLNIATSGHTGITIRSGTTSTGNIFFADGTSSTAQYRGIIRYDHDADAMPFFTAASEAMRIDSSGRVGIGTSSPAQPLHVVGTIRATTDFQLRDTDNNRILVIEDASNDARISNEVNGGDIIFRTNSGSNSERCRILSGGGLTFNGDTAGTNALDDYEEGTWTPLILGSTTNGTWTAASNNGGFYVKIGKQVTAWFNAVGDLSGAAGVMRVHGLPFTSSTNHTPSGAGNAIYSAGSIQYWAGAGAQVIGPLVEPNNTIAYFHTYATNSSQGVQVPVQNTSHNLHAFVTYFVA